MRKIAVAAMLAVGLTVAHASVVDFEGLADRTPIANGYAGVDWTNFYSLDGADYGTPSGYQHAVVSGTNVAYNGYGDPATISTSNAQGFALHDGFFTAAWNDGLQVVATATFMNGTTLSKSFTLNTGGPVDELFGWTELRSVSFASGGGTPNPDLGGGGEHFAVDNLNLAPVPEPATSALALAGLGVIGGVARRRRKTA